MDIPNGCSSNVHQVVFEGDDIAIYLNHTKMVRYDFSSNNIYNGSDDPQGQVLTNQNSDGNIPSYETPFNQNLNKARYKIWYKDGDYGGCGTNCVGCTTCNGCYSTVVTDSTCTSGCTTSCASGCTSGCTTSCTAACTDSYAGRRGIHNDESIITCQGCNSECNNCTLCTSCVEDVDRMYCVLATTCQGCTDGVTLRVMKYSLNKYFDCTAYCQNGLNGLFDGIVNEQEAPIVDISKCVTVVSDFTNNCDNLNLYCLLFTTKYACRGDNYGCLNLNNYSCDRCDGSCDGCISSCQTSCQTSCQGRCVDHCYRCDGGSVS